MTFSCDGCAAAPRLQEMNGCFTELPRPVATYAGHEFRRCPRTSVGSRELYVLALHRDGWMEDIGAARVRRQPAKLVEAIRYVALLRAEREGPREHH